MNGIDGRTLPPYSRTIDRNSSSRLVSAESIDYGIVRDTRVTRWQQPVTFDISNVIVNTSKLSSLTTNPNGKPMLKTCCLTVEEVDFAQVVKSPLISKVENTFLFFLGGGGREDLKSIMNQYSIRNSGISHYVYL